jgi:thiol-disulfide isomerase/thioredoxin
MKKNFIIFLTALLSLPVCAQKVSTIKGKWVNTQQRAPQKMFVYRIEHSTNIEQASSTLDSEGNFVLSFYPKEEGFYTVGRQPRGELYRYIFYLKPGDNVNFEIENEDWTLVGENTQENKEIAKWQDFMAPLEFNAIYFMYSRSTFREFFPLLESMESKIKSYPKAKTNNKKFNEVFEDYKLCNTYDIAQMFLNTPRSEHPQPADFIDFYKKMNIPEFTKSTALLNYPNGVNLISYIDNIKLRMQPDYNPEKEMTRLQDGESQVLEEIQNPELKGEYVLLLANHIKTYPGIMDYKQKYDSYLINDSQKARMRDIVAKLDINEKGNKAVNFTLTDTEGKEHSLSDYLGKLVYIDFWATWCGPCKGEIPFLQKLEEEYKGKNIVFISVSTDRQSDRQKWLDMVKEKKLGGVQLFAGDRANQVINPYHINSIPRFVLIDKEGNLIDGNAPRPSDSEIRPLINAHL